MKELKLWLAVVIIMMVVLLAGCTTTQQPTPPTTVAETTLIDVTATAVPTPTPTSTPAPLPTASPTPSPTSTPAPTDTPTATAAAEEVAFSGVTFTLPAGLNQVATTDVTNAFGAPARVLQFGDSARCNESGSLSVYSVEALRQWQGQGPPLTLLEEALDQPQSDYFPTWGAAIIVRAQKEPIAFQNGRGLRALVMHGQDGYWANNEAFSYDFQGLTSDGRYYVRFCHPLSAPFLLDTYDPAENENPNALPVPPLPDDYEQRITLMIAYNKEVARELEGLAAAAFQPSLELFDALVSSLRVEEIPR